MDGKARRMRISVSPDGPYFVSGDVPLERAEIAVNELGESVAWAERGAVDAPYRYQLCRCGHSKSKPFCDGMHEQVGFDGTETAGHHSFAEIAVGIDGPGVVLHDARRLCAEARFCDRAGGLWNLVEHCDDAETRALVAEEAELCPSGRYVLRDVVTGEVDEPDLPASIVIIEDPKYSVSGPLFVRGGIPVSDAEGEPYEVRNRVTLCRCGHSKNKPFCDGSHIACKFKDESVG